MQWCVWKWGARVGLQDLSSRVYLVADASLAKAVRTPGSIGVFALA